jgi:hypothetical protein
MYYLEIEIMVFREYYYFIDQNESKIQKWKEFL